MAPIVVTAYQHTKSTGPIDSSPSPAPSGGGAARNGKALLEEALAVFACDFAVFAAGLTAGLGLSAAQIASFLCAAVLGALLETRRLPARRFDGALLARLSLVAAMGFFLRSGVLAFLARRCALPPEIAILPAILVSMGVLFVGSRLLLETAGGKGSAWRGELAVLGLAAFFVALRLVYMPSVELLPEEAYYWNYAQHPALGYLDHPPMVAWLISLGTSLFGHNPAGVRLGAALCWVVTVCFLFCMGRDFVDAAASVRAVLLLAALPAWFGVGLFMTPDAPLTACWAGALYFFSRAFFRGSVWAWFGAAACIGLGLDSKYTIALAALAAIVFMLVDKEARRWLRHPAPYGAAALSLVLFAPVILWNARNGWASFAFQGPRRWEVPSRFSLHEFIASIFALLTPVGIGALLPILCRRCPEEEKRRQRFVRIFILVPLAIFAWFSLRHRVEFNWTVPLWLAVLPMLGAAMSRGWLRAWWLPTLAVLALFYGGVLYHQTLGWPGLPYSRHTELLPAGWASFGAQVNGLEDRLELETHREPLVVAVDRYQVVSELIFYDPDQTKPLAGDVGQHLLGQASLMYERWSQPAAFSGRNVVLVAMTASLLKGSAIEEHFDQLTPIREQDITYNGSFVRPFYYRIGYGYRAAPHKATPALVYHDP